MFNEAKEHLWFDWEVQGWRLLCHRLWTLRWDGSPWTTEQRITTWITKTNAKCRLTGEAPNPAAPRTGVPHPRYKQYKHYKQSKQYKQSEVVRGKTYRHTWRRGSGSRGRCWRRWIWSWSRGGGSEPWRRWAARTSDTSHTWLWRSLTLRAARTTTFSTIRNPQNWRSLFWTGS